MLTLSPDADIPGMREQFMCHWQYAEFAEPGKTSWNLEPWRPEVSMRRDGGRPLQSRRHRRTVLVAQALSREEVAAVVDHTLLKPEATDADVTALGGRGRRARGVRGVRVTVDGSRSPSHPRRRLHIASVVGFPSGKHLSAIKAAEAARAVAAGADEIDMVIDVGAAVSGDLEAVRTDIAAVRTAVPDAVLKVIVESAALLNLAASRALARPAESPPTQAPTS